MKTKQPRFKSRLNKMFLYSGKFSRKWCSQGQKCILCDRSILYLPFNLFSTLAFGRVVLYGNVSLSFVELWTKKWSSSFLRKVLVFQKSCFKVKVLKRFKILNDSHVKTYNVAHLVNIKLFFMNWFYCNLIILIK